MPHQPKASDKRARWRRKDRNKRATRHAQIRKLDRMSKTHQNEVMAAGKKIARWMRDRLKSAAPSPTTNEIMTRIHSLFPGPQFSSEDQIGIGRAALAVLKRDDPEGWEKYRTQNPDVMDRPAATQETNNQGEVA